VTAELRIFRNGAAATSGLVLPMPNDSWSAFTASLSSTVRFAQIHGLCQYLGCCAAFTSKLSSRSHQRQLGFPVMRVFNNMGGEFKEIELLRTGDVVFASGGEDFLGIDYSRSADDDYEEELYDAPAGWQSPQFVSAVRWLRQTEFSQKCFRVFPCDKAL
jgi:hypothetical protein